MSGWERGEDASKEGEEDGYVVISRAGGGGLRETID